MIFSFFNNSFLIYIMTYTFIFISLFYIWFKLINIENDINELYQKVNKIFMNPCQLPRFNNSKINNNNFNVDDLIMKDVFNCCGENPCKIKIPKTNNIIIDEEIVIDKSTNNEITDEITNEITDEITDIKNTNEIFDLKKNDIENDKESDISTKTSTKKKLQKLNLDSLKEKCINLNLSNEGTKADLIDRILNTDV